MSASTGTASSAGVYTAPFWEYEEVEWVNTGRKPRELGLNRDGDFERSLGRRLVESLPDA